MSLDPNNARALRLAELRKQAAIAQQERDEAAADLMRARARADQAQASYTTKLQCYYAAIEADLVEQVRDLNGDAPR